MKLTNKQGQILALAARGLKDRSIAETMGISVRTVQNHLSRIYTKTHTGGRMEAAMLYVSKQIEVAKRHSPQAKKRIQEESFKEESVGQLLL